MTMKIHKGNIGEAHMITGMECVTSKKKAPLTFSDVWDFCLAFFVSGFILGMFFLNYIGGLLK